MPNHFIIINLQQHYSGVGKYSVFLKVGIPFTGFPNNIVFYHSSVGNPRDKNPVPFFGVPGQAVILYHITTYCIIMCAVSFCLFPEMYA